MPASPSSASVGRLRCTGPGRPERGDPDRPGDVARHRVGAGTRPGGLDTGAAMSAWRISWKAPRPSWSFGAWPESSTTGASAICAV